MMEDLTWTCHVCGEERPDEFISVYTRVRDDMPFEMQENIRYCNDRDSCAVSAPNTYLVNPPKETHLQDNKYITFKRDEFERHFTGTRVHLGVDEVADAVVIRRQDQFAPAALSAYASNIAMAARILKDHGANGEADQLQRVADYFSDQADAAAEEAYKLPD